MHSREGRLNIVDRHNGKSLIWHISARCNDGRPKRPRRLTRSLGPRIRQRVRKSRAAPRHTAHPSAEWNRRDQDIALQIIHGQKRLVRRADRRQHAVFSFVPCADDAVADPLRGAFGVGGFPDIKTAETDGLRNGRPQQLRTVAVPKREVLRSERRVAQILIAVVAGDVEVGKPYVAVAAARRDERDVPAIGRPCGRVIRRGMLCERHDLARVDIDDRDLEVIVLIRFERQPLPVRRPRRRGIILRRIGDLFDIAGIERHHVQIPIAVAVRGEGKPGAVRVQLWGDVVCVPGRDAGQTQVKRTEKKEMGVAVLFDRKERRLARRIDDPSRSRFDDLRLIRGDVCPLRFGLETRPKQETY